MRHIGKSLIVASTLFVAGSAVAEDMFPYLGADYTQAFMSARNAYNLIYPKTYPGASLYVGTKFHENFGVELGYDWSGRRTKDFTLPNGSRFFGGTVTTPNGLTGNAKIRRTGGYFDVVGSLPVAECTELLASVGFGWVQTKITTSLNEVPGTTSTSSAISSISGQGRGVFRLGIGGIFMVTEMVGVRAKVNWASTSTLRVRGNASFNSLGYDAKAFKGSTTLLVGAFVRF